MSNGINVDRIERRLDELWEIGSVAGGGVTRAAYSENENAAIDYIRDELPKHYEVRIDRFGNLFASEDLDSKRSLYVGSHLDTVYNGGKFDGTMGVVTGLEAIQSIDESDAEPETLPTLAIWRAEEPPRFGKTNFGARGALGRLTESDLKIKDADGISVREAMKSCGFNPTDLDNPTIDFERSAGFLETHPEQARVLEDEGINVGIVTSIRAPVRHRVTVTGRYDHSGATPMDLRRDALVGAAEMIQAIRTLGLYASKSGDAVATVGDITAVNGQLTAVCGEVQFPLDLRSNDEPYRDDIEQEILTQFEEIAERHDLEVETELIDRTSPVDLDPELVSMLESGADVLEIPYRKLPSGAGHDSRIIQLAGVPTGMLFAPSIDGISHNPEEDTPIDSIEDVTSVLQEALLSFPP